MRIYKNPIEFYMIPYNLQYESHDFKSKYKGNNSLKLRTNRKKFVEEFNPYLKTNVSDNLGPELKYFYSRKYSQRNKNV